MSNVKFTQLPNQATLADNTIIPTVNLGTNFTVTAANLKAYTSNVTTLTASGNISGAYILGNGSQLTGLPATYNDANVNALLATWGSNALSTTGNVTAGYVAGNGSLLTNITGANVTGTVANATFATTAGNSNTANTATTATTAGTVTTAAQPNITSVGTLTSVTSTGNITGGNVLTGGFITATGNITGGNVSTAGTVSATGNITGNYFLGNGSQLTGIAASSYGNANVATFLAAYGANTFSSTGNVTTGNLAVTANITSYTERTTTQGNTSTSFTPIYSNGIVQRITATANFSLQAPSGLSAGQSITLIITQDGTGSRAMTPNGVYRFAYGVKTLSTTANSIDMLSIFYDGTNYLCNLVKGYVV